MAESKGIAGRDRQPSKPTNRDDNQVYRVWCGRDPGQDWGAQWECVATFGFLQDCLHYIADLQDNGRACVFQSPTGCTVVTCTDARVVYKPAV